MTLNKSFLFGLLHHSMCLFRVPLALIKGFDHKVNIICSCIKMHGFVTVDSAWRLIWLVKKRT